MLLFSLRWGLWVHGRTLVSPFVSPFAINKSVNEGKKPSPSDVSILRSVNGRRGMTLCPGSDGRGHVIWNIF